MSRFTTFTIVLFILILALIGVWWYFFFEKGTAPAPEANPPVTRPGFTPLNPNGAIPETSSTTPSTPGAVSSSTDPLSFPKVRKLFATPVAVGIVGSSTASTTSVFFVDRGNGHIYNANIEENAPTKLSNTTILRVYQSAFDPQGKNVLMQYIKEDTDVITTVHAKIVQELKARFISNTAESIAVSPKGDRLFSIEKTNTGAIGYVSTLDGVTRTEVFSSPLREWIATWPEENTITLTTKANRLNPGYLYFLDPKNKSMKKILGPSLGLTTNTSADAKKVLYSRSISGKLETRVLTVADGSNQDTLLQTLPEKCVWSKIKKTSVYCAVPSEPLKNLPDDWYKGLTRGVDQIWHLETVTNGVNKVTNLFNETGVSIDAINLTLDPKEQALFFINNTDLSLWSVDLSD